MPCPGGLLKNDMMQEVIIDVQHLQTSDAKKGRRVFDSVPSFWRDNRMTIRMAVVALVSTILLVSTGWSLDSPSTDVHGSPGRCAICGKPGPCQQKICQIQCGIEKVTKSCWCVESQNMCTMLPRRPCANGNNDCGACEDFSEGTGCPCAGGNSQGDSCQPKGLLSRWIENLTEKPLPIIPPQPGRTRAVKKLVKKEYVVEKPVYKPVVQYVCAECLGTPSCGVCDVPAEVSSPSPSDDQPGKQTSPSPQPAPLPAKQASHFAPLPPLE